MSEMREVKRYYQFINEGYTETPEHRINQFFKELLKNIKHWFSEGTFAASEAELVDYDISTLNSIDKNMIFNFIADEFYYQVIVIVSLEGVAEEELIDCFVKIKKYDTDATLIRTLGQDVAVDELDEDMILAMIVKLDDESESAEESPETLDDEDTDLEDTDMV